MLAEKRAKLSCLPLSVGGGAADAGAMTALLVFAAVLAVLTALSLADLTPDTHSDTSQFGHYRF
ncbi:hypothetical protein F8M49_07930 [Rhodococcus zopfii]|uniref:Uncharacterized protein n=1 Tax=Rhodococcus zopfii TaxID=43772 RepID=A0ABU3WMZ9_9NOCA|nr:hypothetical protein [Rhodococcus zopfii]